MVFRILLFDLARLDFVGPARISSGGTCSARLTDRDIMEATTLSLQDSGLTSKPGGKLISNEKGSSEAVDAAVTAVAGSDRIDFLRDKSPFRPCCSFSRLLSKASGRGEDDGRSCFLVAESWFPLLDFTSSWSWSSLSSPNDQSCRLKSRKLP